LKKSELTAWNQNTELDGQQMFEAIKMCTQQYGSFSVLSLQGNMKFQEFTNNNNNNNRNTNSSSSKAKQSHYRP
jgi:hypothetical protein